MLCPRSFACHLRLVILIPPGKRQARRGIPLPSSTQFSSFRSVLSALSFRSVFPLLTIPPSKRIMAQNFSVHAVSQFL
jgi:hypothetical protein